ncbi:MAG: cysteine--tRNA ligase [Candidatus Harrisonbacteria bacterium]|nr:cysteine--tRNA ligase [Candidatus Harrisonbacteria bacterium]
MKIYNTLSQQKEELKKPFLRKLQLFVCGPTVYDNPHIGNGRTFVSFDIIVRYLRSAGFKVFYLQNITNIDDKIILRAQEEHMSPQDLADQYEAVFHKNLESLDVRSVDRYARATDFIPQIIRQIRRLIVKGYAYKIETEGWYFDISKFAQYGKLARRTVEQAEDGVSRIDESEKKKNRGDFALWKFSKEGEPSWDSPLGGGRPGWHIEDTAITETFLGPQYDIHGGAIDLKFPHHEAEIAQQEAASGKKPLARIWMHVGFLTVNGEKMSKSKDNFITINRFLERFSPQTFRMLVFSHHYRSPLNYTADASREAAQKLYTIATLLKKLTLIKSSSGKDLDPSPYQNRFHQAMADDFNSPAALAAIFELISAANKGLWELNRKSAHAIRSTIQDLLKTVGFDDLEPNIPQNVEELFQERELSRDRKQFDKADALRQKIESLGYLIEDTPKGSIVLPKQNL